MDLPEGIFPLPFAMRVHILGLPRSGRLFSTIQGRCVIVYSPLALLEALMISGEPRYRCLNWYAGMDLNHQPSNYEFDALTV